MSNVGTGTLTWSASSNMAWLKVNGAASASGTNTGTLVISVNPSGLSVGTQSGTISIAASGATNTPQNIPVTFTITASPTPSIGLSSTNLSFTGVQGGTSPATQTVAISNSGAATLTWTASGSASWLSISPTSGTVAVGSSNTLSVSVSTTGLAAGTVSTPIVISASGATNTPQTITASLTVTAQPALGLSPSSLSYTATQGAANPANQSVTVSSNGTWTASTDRTWLTVNPTSGSSNGTITARVNTATASLGSNTATITVTGGAITQTVSVTLNLNAPSTSSATLTWNANTDPDLASYRIYISTTQGVYGAPVATVQKPATSYIATGLNVGSTYFFTVTAVDLANNESLHSNEVSRSF